MARLQRVTFVALHQHLGLTSELIRNASELQSEDDGSNASKGSKSRVNEEEVRFIKRCTKL